MKRAYSSRALDARTADDVATQTELLCCAEGCPLRWSVDFGARLCTMHAGADPFAWPGITQRVLDIEADRAFRNQEPKPQVPRRHFTLAAKRDVGQRLRKALRNRGGRDWAERLRDLEERGQRLTDAQRAMWRAALGRGFESIDMAEQSWDEVAA